MGLDALAADLYSAALDPSAFGEWVTYRRCGQVQEQPCLLIITPATAQIWSGGLIQVSEGHYTGYLAATDWTPAAGDRVKAADGTRYEIDQPPTMDRGLWSLVLRKLGT
jgi:hypothetical protein